MTPEQAGADCAHCPLAKGGKPPHRPVLGAGPDSPLGILIGESPGDEEVEVGRPFVGPTGRALDEELAEAGLPRESLFVLNAVACQPPWGKKTERLMQRAVKCCRPLFLAQLQRFPRSTPMLAMGKWAIAQAGGEGGQRGFIQDVEVPQRERDGEE